MRRPLVMVAVAVAAMVAVGVVVTSVAGANARVALIGDSITDWNRGPLEQGLGGRYDLDIRAAAGATTSALVADAQAAASASPDQVVINLGTNDVAGGHSTSATIAELGRLVDLFDDARCIHLVTVSTHMQRLGSGPNIEGAAELNAAVRDLAAGDDRIRVIPWDEVIDDDWRANPPTGTLTEDTVHPTNAAGRARLVELYGEALDGCARWWPA